MKIFAEEQKVLDSLLKEWYDEVDGFTEEANGIFSEKGKMYDRSSPVWDRIAFPNGFVQELRKKVDRIGQLLDAYDHGDFWSIKWGEVLEEDSDVMNYARMFGGLIRMLMVRATDKQLEGEKSKLAGRGVSPRKDALPTIELNDHDQKFLQSAVDFVMSIAEARHG